MRGTPERGAITMAPRGGLLRLVFNLAARVMFALLANLPAAAIAQQPERQWNVEYPVPPNASTADVALMRSGAPLVLMRGEAGNYFLRIIPVGEGARIEPVQMDAGVWSNQLRVAGDRIISLGWLIPSGTTVSNAARTMALARWSEDGRRLWIRPIDILDQDRAASLGRFYVFPDGRSAVIAAIIGGSCASKANCITFEKVDDSGGVQSSSTIDLADAISIAGADPKRFRLDRISNGGGAVGPAPDGDILATATVSLDTGDNPGAFAKSSRNLLVMRVSKEGEIRWAHLIEQSTRDVVAYEGIAGLRDSGLLLPAGVYPGDKSFLVHVDPTGNMDRTSVPSLYDREITNSNSPVIFLGHLPFDHGWRWDKMSLSGWVIDEGKLKRAGSFPISWPNAPRITRIMVQGGDQVVAMGERTSTANKDTIFFRGWSFKPPISSPIASPAGNLASTTPAGSPNSSPIPTPRPRLDTPVPTPSTITPAGSPNSSPIPTPRPRLDIPVPAPSTTVVTSPPTRVASSAPLDDPLKHGHALIIGTWKYSDRRWAQLDDIGLQIQDLQRALKPHFDSVQLLPNPSFTQLDADIRGFLRTFGNDDDARLFIYYAGHGYTEVNESRNEYRGYITGADTPFVDESRSSLAAARVKAISMEAVRGMVSDANARQILFVFDSCFAGTIFTARSPSGSFGKLSQRDIDRILSQPVREFITAGDMDEKVPGHSPIPQLLIRALEGAADPYNVGVITGEQVAQYLWAHTRGLRISPRSGKLPGGYFDRGEFLFRIVSN